MIDIDKRKFPRLGKIWELDYRIISLEEFKENPLRGLTVNISGGGICFESQNEIPKGTMLALELKSTIFPSSIIALGKTIWCHKESGKDTYEVGAEFWWTGWKDNDAQRAVAEYIGKQITFLSKKD
jgi:hypothetical protein